MKIIVSTLLATLAFSLSLSGYAQVAVDQSLPEVMLSNKGELMLGDKDKVSYIAWSSKDLKGRVNVIQHLAARLSTKDLNVTFTDKLAVLEHKPEHYYVTTIVNLDDALFGTSGIVASQLKGNKRKYPQSSIVADKSGIVAKRWALTPENSAILIISPEGKVLYFKDGQLNTEEIEMALAIIDREVATLTSSVAQE